MADMDNTISRRDLQRPYGFSGHPIKDKVTNFLLEVQSDLNTATSDIVVIKAEAPGSTTILQSNIIAAAPPKPDSSASTLVSWGSQMVENISVNAAGISDNVALLSDIGFDLADECTTTASGSSFTAAISQICADTSNANAGVSNNVTLLSNIGFDLADECTTTASGSSFTNAISQICADTSNANAGVSDNVTLLSDIGFTQGDRMKTVPSGSSFTALVSQIVDNLIEVSDAFTATIPSDITVNTSHITFDRKDISDAVAFMGGKLATDPSASTLATYLSTIGADLSNLASVRSDLGFSLGDQLQNTPGSSEFSCLISAFVAEVSNITTMHSDLGFSLGDVLKTTPTGSDFDDLISAIVTDVSNNETVLSDLGFLMGDELGFPTKPSDSTFTALFSQLVANTSNIYIDLNDNVKSNVTALQAQTSDLREAVSLWEVMYASDAFANVSDIKVTMSDLVVLLSNALIAD